MKKAWEKVLSVKHKADLWSQAAQSLPFTLKATGVSELPQRTGYLAEEGHLMLRASKELSQQWGGRHKGEQLDACNGTLSYAWTAPAKVAAPSPAGPEATTNTGKTKQATRSRRLLKGTEEFQLQVSSKELQ